MQRPENYKVRVTTLESLPGQSGAKHLWMNDSSRAVEHTQTTSHFVTYCLAVHAAGELPRWTKSRGRKSTTLESWERIFHKHYLGRVP